MLAQRISQAGFDAPGALRLRISAEELSEAFDKLKPVLGMLGAGTGDIDFAAALANASLTAGRDENSDNTVTVSGAAAGEGTLSATLTMVVRGETQPITAPADGESYKDIAFLSQLAGDVAGTVAQLATGYDLSLSLNADMLGILTLADVDINVKIALDEAGAVQALITADVNAGGGYPFVLYQASDSRQFYYWSQYYIGDGQYPVLCQRVFEEAGGLLQVQEVMSGNGYLTFNGQEISRGEYDSIRETIPTEHIDVIMSNYTDVDGSSFQFRYDDVPAMTADEAEAYLTDALSQP